MAQGTLGGGRLLELMERAEKSLAGKKARDPGFSGGLLNEIIGCMGESDCRAVAEGVGRLWEARFAGDGPGGELPGGHRFPLGDLERALALEPPDRHLVLKRVPAELMRGATWEVEPESGSILDAPDEVRGAAVSIPLGEGCFEFYAEGDLIIPLEDEGYFNVCLDGLVFGDPWSVDKVVQAWDTAREAYEAVHGASSDFREKPAALAGSADRKTLGYVVSPGFESTLAEYGRCIGLVREMDGRKAAFERGSGSPAAREADLSDRVGDGRHVFLKDVPRALMYEGWDAATGGKYVDVTVFGDPDSADGRVTLRVSPEQLSDAREPGGRPRPCHFNVCLPRGSECEVTCADASGGEARGTRSAEQLAVNWSEVQRGQAVRNGCKLWMRGVAAGDIADSAEWVGDGHGLSRRMLRVAVKDREAARGGPSGLALGRGYFLVHPDAVAPSREKPGCYDVYVGRQGEPVAGYRIDTGERDERGRAVYREAARTAGDVCWQHVSYGAQLPPRREGERWYAAEQDLLASLRDLAGRVHAPAAHPEPMVVLEDLPLRQITPSARSGFQKVAVRDPESVPAGGRAFGYGTITVSDSQVQRHGDRVSVCLGYRDVPVGDYRIRTAEVDGNGRAVYKAVTRTAGEVAANQQPGDSGAGRPARLRMAENALNMDRVKANAGAQADGPDGPR